MSKSTAARTYNQNHVRRKYTPGKRRVSMYVAWSNPAEAGRNPYELDNRFSTMTEVRRVAWPDYEAPEWSDPLQFQQGIAGSLELFFWAWAPFQQLVGEATDHVVPVFQRIDQAGFKLPIDERAQQRAAARAEWNSVRDKPLDVGDVIGDETPHTQSA